MNFLFNTWLGGFLCGGIVVVAVVIKSILAVEKAWMTGYNLGLDNGLKRRDCTRPLKE